MSVATGLPEAGPLLSRRRLHEEIDSRRLGLSVTRLGVTVDRALLQRSNQFIRDGFCGNQMQQGRAGGWMFQLFALAAPILGLVTQRQQARVPLGF